MGHRYWIWSFYALFAAVMLVRLASMLFQPRGEDEAAAALRARAQTTVRLALQRFMMAVLFLPAGALLITGLDMAPAADLTKIVRVFGGLIFLFGCWMFLDGASLLLTARSQFRDLKRGAGDSAP